MPNETTLSRHTVMHSGFPRPLPGDQWSYEAITSDATEAVAYRLLKKGTAVGQLALTDSTTDVAIAIGRIQKFFPGEVSGKVNPEYVKDGDPIRSMSVDSPAVVTLKLDFPQTIVYGNKIGPGATTAGCVADVSAVTGASVIGIAVEDVTTTSAIGEVLVQLRPATNTVLD